MKLVKKISLLVEKIKLYFVCSIIFLIFFNHYIPQIEKLQFLKKINIEYLIPFIIPCGIIVILGIILYLYSKLKFTKNFSKIDKMTGHDFECFAGNFFRKQGYKVIQTPASNDQGADLIIEKKAVKAVVQAKRYSKKVTNTAIQEVVAAKAFYKANTAIVITNNFFTQSAFNLAQVNNVILMDRDYLKSNL